MGAVCGLHTALLQYCCCRYNFPPTRGNRFKGGGIWVSCWPLTMSCITVLVLGPNGHLAGKHKDRAQSHITTQPSTPPPIQADTPLENVTADMAEPPEVQSTSVEVPIVPKPK